MNIKGDLAIIAVALMAILVVLIAGTLMLVNGGSESTVAEATEAVTTDASQGSAIVGPIDEDCDLVIRSASLAVRAGAWDRLVDAGAAVDAVAPAADIGRGSASLAIRDASGLNCRLSEGVLATEGGLRFTVGGKSVTVNGLEFDMAEGELTADVASPDFSDRVRLDAAIGELGSLDRGDEIVYVLPVNLLSNDAGTLEDALQKATLSEGGLSSDGTLTLIAARA